MDTPEPHGSLHLGYAKDSVMLLLTGGVLAELHPVVGAHSLDALRGQEGLLVGLVLNDQSVSLVGEQELLDHVLGIGHLVRVERQVHVVDPQVRHRPAKRHHAVATRERRVD